MASYLFTPFLKVKNYLFIELFPPLSQDRKKHHDWMKEEAERDPIGFKRPKSTGVIPILLHIT